MSEKSESEELESFLSKGELLTCIESSHFLLKNLGKAPYTNLMMWRMWFKEHKPDLKGVAPEEDAKRKESGFCLMLHSRGRQSMGQGLAASVFIGTQPHSLAYVLSGCFELQGQS